jgi:hypothetical protein
MSIEGGRIPQSETEIKKVTNIKDYLKNRDSALEQSLVDFHNNDELSKEEKEFKNALKTQKEFTGALIRAVGKEEISFEDPMQLQTISDTMSQVDEKIRKDKLGVRDCMGDVMQIAIYVSLYGKKNT